MTKRLLPASVRIIDDDGESAGCTGRAEVFELGSTARDCHRLRGNPCHTSRGTDDGFMGCVCAGSVNGDFMHLEPHTLSHSHTSSSHTGRPDKNEHLDMSSR